MKKGMKGILSTRKSDHKPQKPPWGGDLLAHTEPKETGQGRSYRYKGSGPEVWGKLGLLSPTDLGQQGLHDPGAIVYPP